MPKQLVYRWGILPLWLLLTASVCFRQPIPIDETRYLSVAWEMWLRGDFRVPYLNGQPYSHKQPLLFWLFQLGWAIFGVNDSWPKLVGPLCALANLLLLRKVAEKLWPQQTGIALLAPWILIATLLWTVFATSAMFDILLTCFVLLGVLGLLELTQGAAGKGAVYLAVAIGLGLLAKGPVVFLHLLPVMVTMSFWLERGATQAWLAKLLAAVAIGIGIALLWAVPAALSGGPDYANEIFWKQIADRTITTEIHVRPFYWYLPLLPLLLFPWFFWMQFWKNLRSSKITEDRGAVLCLVWLLMGFLLFSGLASKQIHYLIPLLPAFALLVAWVLVHSRQAVSPGWELAMPGVFAVIGLFLLMLPRVPGLAELQWVQTVEPGWGLAVLGVAVVLGMLVLLIGRLAVMQLSLAVVFSVFLSFMCFFKYTGLAFDLRPAALLLKTLNDQEKPCAFVGNYQGQLHFLGRLTQPLPSLTNAQAGVWGSLHPDGYLITLEKQKPVDAYYQQPHREYWLVFRSSTQFARLKPL